MHIHHVNITIPPGQEDEARAFYCDLLGLPEIEKPASLKPKGGLWLRVGDRDLHISIQADGQRHTNNAHIAYQVEDLAAFRGKIEKAGLPIRESTPIPGYERFECRDPFGNRVEFITPIAPPPARQLISSGAPWETTAGYSRGVRVGDRVLIAGTTAVQGGSVVAPGDAYAQTVYIFRRIIGPALAEAGARLRDVVRTRMFATDIGDFDAIGRAHGEIFAEVRPASTLLEVSALVDPAMRVEIEAEAIIDPSR